MHSSLKCRGHAGCSCTYQITTSSSDRHNPPCTSSCPHTHSHSITHITHILYKHTHWTSICLGYTAVDVVIVIVFHGAALKPTAGSAVLLAPQRQYPLSSSAFPPPSPASSLPWLTSVRLLFLRNTYTLYSLFSLFFLSFSETASKHSNTVQCIVIHFYTQVSIYSQICLSLSLSFPFSQH